MPAPRIGITLRMTRVERTGEWRDALATDWARYLDALCAGMPTASWVMLPNTGESVIAYAQALGVTGLILSGGDDIGVTPQRDATEMALLRHAAAQAWPVLGVCRGLQMLQHFCGGAVAAVDADRHVATRHPLHWMQAGGGVSGTITDTASDTASASVTIPSTSPTISSIVYAAWEGGDCEVNSYHARGLTPDMLADALEVLAVCPQDGTVEAVRGKSLPWLGIMWHPEREVIPCVQNMDLLRRHLLSAPPSL